MVQANRPEKAFWLGLLQQRRLRVEVLKALNGKCAGASGATAKESASFAENFQSIMAVGDQPVRLAGAYADANPAAKIVGQERAVAQHPSPDL